jgi:transposase
MMRFIEGECRDQVTLLPECLDDFIGEDNPVRIVDAFVDELDLRALGFNRAAPASTGLPTVCFSPKTRHWKSTAMALGMTAIWRKPEL